jgi:CheY-like chemotaxis protein
MARILVVAADADMRELLELTLAEPGHHVDSVSTGPAALERRAQHAYDLVVCDLDMPDLDVVAVSCAIARQPPPRPALMFVTGYADAGPYEDWLRTTHAAVVGKPFDIMVLRETVRRVLSGA